MRLNQRDETTERLDQLVQDAAGRVRRIHLLAAHVLHKLSYAEPSQMARASCPLSGEESVDSDAESGWRLAA